MSNEKIIIGVGELLWDVYGPSKVDPNRISKRPGGAPANQAFHANQMGAKGIIFSAVGDDENGQELLEFLNSNNLDCSSVQVLPEVKTGWVEVDLSRGEPRYTIHKDVAWDQIAINDNMKAIARKSSAICFGTLAQRGTISRQTIEALVKEASSALKIFDINLRQNFYDKELVENGLRVANIVKLNDQECIALKPLLGTASDQPEEFAKEIIEKYDVDIVCVTMAEKGCLIVTHDQAIPIEGKTVNVVSPVGAGDAFTSAFTWAYLNQWSLEKAAGFANDVGALVCEHIGAMPEIKEKVELIKSRWC